MLKKKSLARVINRSSKNKCETGSHCSASSSSSSSSSSQLNTRKKKYETNVVNNSKSYQVKSLHQVESSCGTKPLTIAAQVNKMLTNENTRKGDAIKVDSKQSQSATDVSTLDLSIDSLQHRHTQDTQLLESPTLTTQQLLEQYPDICSQSKSTKSSTYQLSHPPPRPPKPLRYECCII